MTFGGEVLSVARRAKGITQERLADTAGITQAALSRYENSLREPGLTDDEIAQICGYASESDDNPFLPRNRVLRAL